MPERLSDTIVSHIQQLIVEGSLRPGEKLRPERELSVKLDVSRPTLREAMEKLIESGLISKDAAGAAFISESVGRSIRDPLYLAIDTPDGLFHYLEFRQIVDPEAAALAAQRASEPDRQLMKRHLDRMGAARRSGDVEEHEKADAGFHLAIYDASHNIVIMHIFRSLSELQRSTFLLARELLSRRRVDHKELQDSHVAIFEAIVKNDPDAARNAARDHVRHSTETLREILEAQKRLEVATRRLQPSQLVTQPKRQP